MFLLATGVYPLWLSARFDKDEVTPQGITEKVKQVKVGNFALTNSQQPGPLIGFGQNIIDKGELQIFAVASYLKGEGKKFSEFIPSLLYGINDALSIFFQVPIAVKFEENNQATRSFEDLIIQLEYAYYNRNTLTLSDQITLVANVSAPSGSASKNPSTGFGAPGFFIGFTAAHMTPDWYYFTSSGVSLTTSHNHDKSGNQFLYQCGLSKNIWYSADEQIFNWMLELDGIYKQKDKKCGKMNCNSGGNQLLLGPSLWFSTPHFIAQIGISWVMYQHLLGKQNNDHYLVVGEIGWKF